MTNVGVAKPGADGGNFVVQTSTDGGQTWSDPANAKVAGTTAHFPGLFANDASSFSAVWSSDLTTPANQLLFQKFTVS